MTFEEVMDAATSVGDRIRRAEWDDGEYLELGSDGWYEENGAPANDLPGYSVFDHWRTEVHGSEGLNDWEIIKIQTRQRKARR